MYKVAIIDDEPIIVEGLMRIIQWEKYDCKVIATANDGMEGITLIKEHKPNIIISDIAMPGLDGLSMIAALKSEYPNMMISILTGYRDFDYAQKAIKLGVTRFMLKPSNLDEIEEALKAMIQELKERNILGVEDKAVSGENGAAGIDDASVKNDTGSFIVKNAIKYIEENYNQKLTLSELAEKTYVSQWHLSKLLNRHTQQNFSELLNSVRIKEAKKLLKCPELRIGDVAEAVGFIDMAHFSRVFKKTTGMSANEYRNKINKDEIQ